MVKFLGSALDIPPAVTLTEAVQRGYVDNADGALSDRVGVLESGGGAGGSSLNFSAREVSGPTTALVGDFILADSTSGSLTVTLPRNPPPNSCLGVKKVDDSLNHVTVVGQGGALIEGDLDLTLLVPLAAAVLIYEGTDWHVESTAVFDLGLHEFTYRGDWTTGVDYVVNDVVFYQGSSYIAKQDNNSVPPTVGTSTANWGQLAVQGAAGTPGVPGTAGPGVSTGGATGQALIKRTGADYDTQWQLLLPTGGSAGQVLSKIDSSNFNTSWSTVTGTVPPAGATGQVLTKTSGTDYATSWQTAAAGGSLTPTSVQTAASVPASVGQLVLVNASSNAIQVTLPAAALGATVAVKRLDAATTTVTVQPLSGTIDGDANLSLVGLGSGATLVADGTNWQISSTALVNSGTDSAQQLLQPTYTLGNWFDRRSASPIVVPLLSVAAATNGVTVNTCVYVPMYAHRAVNFDRLGLMTGTATPTANSAVRLGVFAMKADGTPGSRQTPDYGSFSLGATPSLALTFTASGTVPKGWSFWGIAYNATSPGSLTGTGTTLLQPNTGQASFVYTNALNTPAPVGYFETISGGAIPATANPTALISTSTITSVYMPNVWFRVAA